MKHKAILKFLCFHLLLSAFISELKSEEDLLKIKTQCKINAGLTLFLEIVEPNSYAEFMEGNNHLISVLSKDKNKLINAKSIASNKKINGRITFSNWNDLDLPYLNRSVNLIISSDFNDQKNRTYLLKEILRVLAPRGLAFLKTTQQNDMIKEINDLNLKEITINKFLENWVVIEKSVLPNTDDFTHFNRDASGNRYSNDSVAEIPWGLQWIAGPDITCTPSGPLFILSEGGQVVFAYNDMYRFSKQATKKVFIEARDAYSGALYWKQRTYASSRLNSILSKDYFFTCLQQEGPLVALDKTNGKIKKTYKDIMDPEMMIYQDGKIFVSHKIQNSRTVSCLDVDNEKIIWSQNIYLRSDGNSPNLAINKKELYFYAHSKKGAGKNRLGSIDLEKGSINWEVDTNEQIPTLISRDIASHENGIIIIGEGKKGKAAYAFDMNQKGKLLWTTNYQLVMSGRNARHKGSSYTDGYFSEGLYWYLAGRGKDARGDDRRAIGWKGADPITGKIMQELNLDDSYIGDSCHITFGTPKFFTGGHSKYYDRETKKFATRSYGFHNGCGHGHLAANGHFYTGSHYNDNYLNGFYCLTGKKELDDKKIASIERLFTHQPTTIKNIDDQEDWPIYRNNYDRNNTTLNTTTPASLNKKWSTQLGDKLLPPIVADKKVFIFSQSFLTLYALNEETGKIIWSTPLDGNAETPPTFYKGQILLGSSNGYVYSINADTGNLNWSFLAAKLDKRIIKEERISSIWPVNSGVIVKDEKVVFFTGRHGTVDDGGDIYCLNLSNGEKIWTKTIKAETKFKLLLLKKNSVYVNEKIGFSLADGSPTSSLDPDQYSDINVSHNMAPTKNIISNDVFKQIITIVDYRALISNKERIIACGLPGLKLIEKFDTSKILRRTEDREEIKTGVLAVFDKNGKVISKTDLSSVPEFDNLALAYGKIFATLKNGYLECYSN